MSRIRTVAIVVGAVIAAGLIWWLVFGRSGGDEILSGYVEADDLYLAAPQSGTLASVAVQEGGTVGAGERLFTIDPSVIDAQGRQAEAQIAEAQTQAAASAASAQQSEAQVRAAEADLAKARDRLNRLQKVEAADSAAVAGTDLDQARAAVREASARVNAAREAAAAQRAQTGAARAGTEQARAGASEVQARLDQLSPAAPVAARVEDVFYQVGEWVPANQPVIGLIPDSKVKLRFFVPEAEVQRYKPGARVHFSCDGCAPGLRATISKVSSRPEYTPPVIFSRTSRDRLVFMVEALPEKPSSLRPGLPVDVEPLP